MNPLAEKAIKNAYECIEYIKSFEKDKETFARRMYLFGVINTLWNVELITVEEEHELVKEMERKIPYHV